MTRFEKISVVLQSRRKVRCPSGVVPRIRIVTRFGHVMELVVAHQQNHLFARVSGELRNAVEIAKLCLSVHREGVKIVSYENRLVVGLSLYYLLPPLCSVYIAYCDCSHLLFLRYVKRSSGVCPSFSISCTHPQGYKFSQSSKNQSSNSFSRLSQVSHQYMLFKNPSCLLTW